jgi:superfamily II DNA or RNA helicase
MDAYIGKRGYSIRKDTLTVTELLELRDELSVTPNMQCNGYASNIKYPIYRESGTKIYIPRYFGLDKFGKVNKNTLSHGVKCNLFFEGSLFPYQENIINKYLNFVGKSGGGLLDVEPGKGKTVMALNIISRLNRKTLVVVHKTFLLNQWKERITQFLPNARVGQIQGQILDFENKDIVIGMLQTLSTKTLPDIVTEQFGLTVYDECHHLSAEVFSNVMNKIVTNYSLGLSGTMTRKDGLTKVFKYFIGPVIHKEKTDNNTKVVVNTILFEDPENDEYNEVETDYKGNPMYSKMITKLCKNENRTSMIVNIIRYELKRDEKQQIMILAHNKSLINELFINIQKFEPSIGFYIGGMKENELKKSEDKRVIIATYAMASEGLDIKTLTTLLMATPKSDVCQSIGRILRSKHANPLVIDVIDVHQIFKNQFQKRKQYYKKKEYLLHQHLNLTNYLNSVYKEVDLSKKTKHLENESNIKNNTDTKDKKTSRPTCMINLNDI